MRPALLLAAAVLATGCGTASVSAAAPSPAPASTAPAAAAGDCPTLKPDQPGQQVAVDYGDFLQADGQLYLPDPVSPGTLTSSDVGAEQFRVRCSFGRLNDLTHLAPPAARDGDASFLAPGTPVHAVNGWAPSCRLAAQLDGTWHVYLARDAKHPDLPVACASSPATADPASPEPALAADCPVLPPAASGSFAAVDYVDFLNAGGRQYLSSRSEPAPTAADRGALVLRIRCSFSELNDRTHQMTPQPRDGDAAFLPAGTPVYAVNGWPTRCRLMAVATDAWQLYVASPQPTGCGVR